MSKRQILQYNPKLKNRSRSLRKNMTEAEVNLWIHIRKKQIANLQFYRQRPIGNYIADFYCPDAELVIEVDGGQHFQEEGLEYDRERDSFLEGLGLKVLRFSNLDVLQNKGRPIKVPLRRACPGLRSWTYNRRPGGTPQRS